MLTTRFLHPTLMLAFELGTDYLVVGKDLSTAAFRAAHLVSELGS